MWLVEPLTVGHEKPKFTQSKIIEKRVGAVSCQDQ